MNISATLVLVRHGESLWIAEGRFQGRQDPPLSAIGQRQAGLVGARLAQRDDGSPLPIPHGPPVAIWHSPLSRAAATAQAIAAAQPDGVELRAEERLTEIAQGEWEGMPHSEVSSRWATELAAWRHSPATSHAPDGEPLADAAVRVAATLADITAALGGRSSGASYGLVPGYASGAPDGGPPEPWAVLVAHDGIFRLTLMTLLLIPIERFWSFPFSLCAITVIALREGVPIMRAHNLAEHLAPLADDVRAAARSSSDRPGAL